MAELGFTERHFAGVGFVVHPGEVQEAVEEEDTHFVGEGVAVFGGLALGGLERECEVARVADLKFTGCRKTEGRKTQNVGGFVSLAEGAIQAAEGGIAGEEDFDLAGESDSGLSFGCEAGQTGARETPRRPRVGVRGSASRRLDGNHACSDAIAISG